MSYKIPIFEIYVAKDIGGLTGDLTLAVRDPETRKVRESETIRNIPIRTGGKKFRPCPNGDFYLWVARHKILQFDDLDATGSEIGRFYPISSSPTESTTIRADGQVRLHIGLHDENDFVGSAGCIVTIHAKDFEKICRVLDVLTFRYKLTTIPIKVFQRYTGSV